MSEIKNEETIDNQLLTKEEIAEVEDLGDKSEDELTPDQKANKKLYARMKTYQEKGKEEKKKSQEEIDKLNAKIKELELKGKPTEELKKEKEVIEQKLDPIEFAKQVRNLSSLSDDELAYAQILAKGMDKKVEEVISTEQFKTWSAAKKVEEETKKNTLDPSNKYKEKTKEDPVAKKWTDNLPQRYK